MDIAERTTAQESSPVYDGFISYSHAADDLLAPRLQAGLQRFAKPWWMRRALRIFRDESSLSANPHLWSSITEALDQSGWFVLLLSPDAASSEWVNQEIEYWKDHKDSSRILPVLTDGTFEWTDAEVSGTAVPEQLQGSFTEEPRWVDMRFARDETDLDLKDPRFADAIADIASALRGVPKDELASEEVKQHRRTIRTAWAAAALVLLLGIAAVFAAIAASQNSEEAERQAAIAEQNADEAQTQRDRAEANAEAEATARSEAEDNAKLARARELAASAILATEEDAQLGLLLALQAIKQLPPDQTSRADLENALRIAMAGDKLLDRHEVGSVSGGSNLAVSPDGDLLVVSADNAEAEVTGSRRNVLQMLDAATLEPLWSYSPDTNDFFTWVGFSSDGEFAYLSVWDRNSTFREVEPDEAEGDARIIVFDALTGDIVRTEIFEGACQVSALPDAWREDLGLFGFGIAPCADEFSGVVRIVNTSTWDTVFEWEAADNAHAVFAKDSPTVALFAGFNSQENAAVYDTTTWEPHAEDLPYAWGDLSPDGTVLAAAGFQPFRGVYLIEVESGQQFDRFVVPQFPWRPTFSSDGDRLAIGSFADVVTVVDPTSGETLFEVDTGRMEGVDFTGTDLFTSWEGTVFRWDGSGTTGGDLNTVPLGLWVNGNSIWWSHGTVASHVADISRNEWFIYPVDAQTGSLGEPLPGLAQWTPLTNGRIAYMAERDVNPEVKEIGPLQVIDLASGDATELAGCWMEMDAADNHSLCPDGTPHPSGALLRMGDKTGETFMIMDSIAEGTQPAETWATVWDAQSLQEIGRFSLGVVDACCGQLDRSKYTDDYVVIHNDWLDSILGVMDRFTGKMVDIAGEMPAAPIRRLEHDRAHNRLWFSTAAGEIGTLDLDQLEISIVAEVSGDIRAMASSPTGDRIALGTPDDNLWVFSDEGELLHKIPLTNPSDGWWIDDSHIVVGTANGPWTTITLETETLLQKAGDRVRRGFTETECAFYDIDPCPTLDEFRSR